MLNNFASVKKCMKNFQATTNSFSVSRKIDAYRADLEARQVSSASNTPDAKEAQNHNWRYNLMKRKLDTALSVVRALRAVLAIVTIFLIVSKWRCEKLESSDMRRD